MSDAAPLPPSPPAPPGRRPRRPAGRLWYWLTRRSLWAKLRRPHWTAALLLALGLALFAALLPDGLRRSILAAFMRHPVASIMLLAFIALALSLLWKTGQRIDQWVFMNFNMRGAHPRWLDWLMLGLTQLGSGVVAFILAGVVYFTHQVRFAVVLILGTLSLWLLVELLKATIRRPRPYNLEGARMVGMRMPGRSFPSGHTSQAFFMAVLLPQMYLGGLLLTLLLFLATGVGLTRMYVGAHYPRDVLAGAVLGTLWGLLAGLVL